MTAIFLLSSPISVLSSSYPDNIYLEWGPEQPETLEEAVTMANTEIGYEYFDIKEANRYLWENSMPKFLVYGSPLGDKKGNKYRYLGYTPEGEPFTNIEYPHDANNQPIRHNGKIERSDIKKIATGVFTPEAFAKSVDTELFCIYRRKCIKRNNKSVC